MLTFVFDKSVFMEDIRIYHSIWKNIALLAVCFVFVAMGIFMLLGIIMNRGLKTYEVRFADVECFYLTKVETARGKTMLIVIQYKENVELQKFEDASKAGRAVRRFNKNVAGSQYTLPADGLTIKPKDLCEILNERVKNSLNI